MEKVRIGFITSAYGLKGQVKIVLTTSDPKTRYKKGSTVFIGNDPSNTIEMIVSEYREKSSSSGLLSFKNLNDINLIEKYIGMNIYAFKTPLKEGFYIDDILNSKVVSQSGKEYGVASKAQMINGIYYLQVEKTLVPLDRPRFILEVNLENKVITLSELGEELFL